MIYMKKSKVIQQKKRSGDGDSGDSIEKILIFI